MDAATGTDRRVSLILLPLALTAVFVGYLMVWLPGPAAGLSLLGIEMGEWFKFAGLGARRDLFYLPPLTLGLLLALWTMTWPRNGRRAWLLRGVAVLVALLAFPAVEDITGPARQEYLLRAFGVVVVAAVALLSGFWRPRGRLAMLPWLLMAVIGLFGGLLPLWLYAQVRPFVSDLFGVSVGVGAGVVLATTGHLLVTAVAVWQMVRGWAAG